MSETWFIGDTHLGHQNILKYEPIARPFNNITEMNEAIVERWNTVVKKHDKVYHLGDFAFGRHNIAIAGQLQGQKRLILGNHDAYPADMYLKYFLSVHGALFWNKFILTHVPVHPSTLIGRAVGNIHGHTHSKCVMDQLSGEPNNWYYNVSCEQNNLTPINADILLQRVGQMENYANII